MARGGVDTIDSVGLARFCHGGVDHSGSAEQVRGVGRCCAGGEPQRVTRRGRPAVVVMAEEEYERLCQLDTAEAPSFGELLLEIPQGDQEFERISISPRSLDL